MIDGEWDDFVPVRLPVDWEYRGDAGIHPDIEGVTGKQVVLLIEKRFTRFEKILAKKSKVKQRKDDKQFKRAFRNYFPDATSSVLLNARDTYMSKTDRQNPHYQASLH